MNENRPQETPVLKLSETAATLLIVGMFLVAATLGTLTISIVGRKTENVVQTPQPKRVYPHNLLFAVEKERSSFVAYSMSDKQEDAQVLFELQYVISHFTEDNFTSFVYCKDDTVEVRFDKKLSEDELHRRAKKYSLAVSIVANSRFRRDREVEVLWKKNSADDVSSVTYEMALVAPKPEDKG